MKTQSITSVGNLAGQLQSPVSKILAIAKEHSIKPAIIINLVPHWDDEDAQRIADYVHEDRAARNAAHTN